MKRVQGEYIGGNVDGKNKRSIRPWGLFEVLDTGKKYKVKRLVIDPGHSISYQYHKHRNEHWFVTSGIATIKLGKNINTFSKYKLNVGESIDIVAGECHQLLNTNDTPLVIIEVQTGGYLEEDDIICLEDPYKR